MSFHLLKILFVFFFFANYIDNFILVMDVFVINN